MTLAVGSINVDANANCSGSGLAFALFSASKPTLDEALSRSPEIFDDPKSGMRVSVYQGQAKFFTGLAQGIVPYFQANAVARVTTQSLGKTTSSGNPIDPPTTEVDLPIS